MRVKQIGPNKLELGFEKGILLFSYDVPVAILTWDGKLMRTASKYSMTTEKHINQWVRDSGVEASSVETVSQKYLDELVEGIGQ